MSFLLLLSLARFDGLLRFDFLGHFCPGSTAVSLTHRFALAEDGRFYGWGVGENGELGAEQGFVKVRFGSSDQVLCFPRLGLLSTS